MKSPPPRPPSHCANCGAEIPPRANACPECGADERTGWAEQSIYDGLELPEDGFSNGDGSGEAEAAAAKERGRQMTQWFWRVVGLLVLASLIAAALALR